MIISAILYLLFAFIWLLTFPLRMANDVSLSPELTNSLTDIINSISALNGWIPLLTIITVIGIIFSIEVGIATYKLIMWIIKLARG